jgi:hypothetical protein
MSGTGNISAVIPAPVTPLVDGDGNITVPWRAFFLVLQRRTGGTAGISTGDNAALVAAERGARIAADQGLQIALDAETAARKAADDGEAEARINGDANLAASLANTANQLANEIVRATGAEALLVPIASLCSLWGACDLSFLPTSDPGSGLPWIDGNHLAIGSGLVPVDISLEDGSGFLWTLEGGGDWLWG